MNLESLLLDCMDLRYGFFLFCFVLFCLIRNYVVNLWCCVVWVVIVIHDVFLIVSFSQFLKIPKFVKLGFTSLLIKSEFVSLILMILHEISGWNTQLSHTQPITSILHCIALHLGSMHYGITACIARTWIFIVLRLSYALICFNT